MNNKNDIPNTRDNSSIIDPYYLTGSFFSASKGYQDSDYKVAELKKIIKLNISEHLIKKVADVGCGAGHTTFAIQKMLSELFHFPLPVDGYDIHPQVDQFQDNANVRFFRQDFTQKDVQLYDLVILFDVIEHVPDPITFLKGVSSHGRYLVLHIPLDNSWMCGIRNLWRANLSHPGHLIILDVPTALNLLTFSGLRIRDYSLSPAFTAPSGKETRLQKILYPFRTLLYQISPYLLQQSLGGVSLTILAENLAFDSLDAKYEDSI
jgi:SAM-dependent methyltransferase